MTLHPRDKPSTPTPSLHSRLVFADEASLSILGSDTAAMQELFEYWVDLQASLEDAIASGTATGEILALASKVASRTKYIADNVISLYEDVHALNASFSDMRTLFRELSLEDKSSTRTPAKHDPTKNFPLPAYIKPAYEWLLVNIHNPYPSKEVKRTISTETNTSIAYIENWFTDARRKIGWTTLSKERFYNKRSLIVEAATRTFYPASTTFRSSAIDALASTSEDFDNAFHQIEDNAKNLYVDKLYETNLAHKVVESASADFSSQAESESPRRRIESSFSPSPSTPYSSPQPEQSPQTFSRKRRSTRSPDAEDTLPRSYKRTRYTSPQETICNTPTNMPSPSLSVVDIRSTVAEALPRPSLPIVSSSLARQGKRKRQTSDEADLTESPILSSIRENSIPISHSAKRKRVPSDLDNSSSTPPVIPSVSSGATPSQPQTRKRRLSDATGERPTKRPHGMPSAPRLQTVSDPYPYPIPKPVNPLSEFDLWWSSSIAFGQPITLGHPEPVVTEPIALDDSTVPLDITWNTGIVVPPTGTASTEKPWTELLQGGVEQIDSIFTNFFDPKVFEQQYNADLFPQDTNQNLLGFDAIHTFPMSTSSAPDSFPNVSQSLGFASSQSESADLSQFYNITLPDPTTLLQSLYTSAMAPTLYDHSHTINTFEDKSAKAAKIQRLREELQRLEAEVV